MRHVEEVNRVCHEPLEKFPRGEDGACWDHGAVFIYCRAVRG